MLRKNCMGFQEIRSRENKNAGFSLVELMVALLLSSFLLLGVVEIYLSNKQSNNLQNGFSQVQENGRMAVEILSREIRRADFWGCLPDSKDIMVNLNTWADPGSSLNDLNGGGIGGANDVDAGTTVDGTTALAGTDTLVLQGSEGSSIKVEKPYMPTPAGDIHINTGSGVQPDDLMLISDCSVGNYFQVTSANPDQSGSVTHNTGTGSIGNWLKDFQKAYGADARVLLPYFKTYFIANDPNGQPSLFLSNGIVAAELIPGVEDMQIVYGEDTSGNLAVDAWADADGVTDMDQVIAIRVVLSVRSYDPVGATQVAGKPADRRLRKTYTVTTNIRNRMI